VLEWTSAKSLRYDVLRGPAPGQVETVVASGLPATGTLTQWTDSCTEQQQFYRVRIVPAGP
jgi:hypothetical protein